MDEATLQRSALIAISVTSFTTPMMLSGVNVALPAIGDAFGADAVTLSWVATAYLLSNAVFLLPFGKYADIVGRIVGIVGAILARLHATSSKIR